MLELLKEKRLCKPSMDSHTNAIGSVENSWQRMTCLIVTIVLKSGWDKVKNTENRHIYYAYWNYMNQLVEFMETESATDEHLSLVTSFYDKLGGTLKIELDEYLESCINHYSK